MKIRILVLAVLVSGGIVASYGAIRAQAQQPASSSESRSVWDGVYTEEQAQRGEPLYREGCASCHGDTLKGSGETPPLVGNVFLSDWNGLPLGDLFERIRRTMPQDKPGRVSRQRKADILAYILSTNKFPAGKTDLPHQTEFLNEIRFEATKPDPKK
jgi:cytochrome c